MPFVHNQARPAPVRPRRGRCFIVAGATTAEVETNHTRTSALTLLPMPKRLRTFTVSKHSFVDGRGSVFTALPRQDGVFRGPLGWKFPKMEALWKIYQTCPIPGGVRCW